MPPLLTAKLVACLWWAAILSIHAQMDPHGHSLRLPRLRCWTSRCEDPAWPPEREAYEIGRREIAKEYDRLKELQCRLEAHIEQIRAQQESLQASEHRDYCHCERFDEFEPDADTPASSYTDNSTAESGVGAGIAVNSSPESASIASIASINDTASSNQAHDDSDGEAKSDGAHMSMQTMAILVVLCVVPVAILIGVIILYKQR